MFIRGLPIVAVTDATIPDPYTPPDGVFNITGDLAVSSQIRAGGTTITSGVQLEVTQETATSGSPNALLVTGAAHTTLATTAEAIDINLNLARTVQWAAGNITTQRAVNIAAPTYAVAGAGGTITDAITFYINAAPTAGTGATLTNAYAILVDAGLARFDGNVILGGGEGGTPAANTLRGPNATGSDIAGSTVTVANSLGTGAGNAGTMNFQGATTINATGSSAHSNVTLMTIGNAMSGQIGTAGLINCPAITYTDRATAGSGTATAASIYTFQQPTIAASNSSVTTTTAATVHILGSPSAGTNMTLTNTFALRCDSPIMAPAGTVSAPSVRFGTPSNLNGIYSATSTTVDISTGGANSWRFSSVASIYTQAAQISGSPTALLLTLGAHDPLAAGVEAIDVNINGNRTVRFGTGALTTQRMMVIQGPTYNFNAASTLTTAVTLAITAAPSVGAAATFTNAFALNVGGAATLASTAALLYGAINVPAHTITLTGTTQVTSTGPAGVSINQITLTDSSSVTVDTASSLYINNAPVAAGSVTLTTPYALWSDAGNNRFDGTIIVGGGEAGTPAANTLRGPNATGTDIAGATTTVATSLGTGAGNAGTMNLQAATTINATGSSAHSAVTLITLGNTMSGQIGTTGLINYPAITYTDRATAGSGTAANAAINTYQQPTIAASNTLVTTTDAYTVYIANAPTAGTNMTLTSAWALGVAAGNCKFSGAVMIGLTTGSPAARLQVSRANTSSNSELMNFQSSAWTQTITSGVTNTRYNQFNAPTITAASAQTVTNAYTLQVSGAPLTAGSAVITNAFALEIGGATTQATAAGLIYATIDIPAHTVTLTGTTQVTSTAGASAIRIGQITLTDSSAVTVDSVASLYIAAAPLAAGSVTLTKTYSLWIDAGLPRIDSTSANAGGTVSITNVGPTGAQTTIQEWLTIDIAGTTRYIPCF